MILENIINSVNNISYAMSYSSPLGIVNINLHPSLMRLMAINEEGDRDSNSQIRSKRL